MVLRNFMCHSLLEVDFETNINFIIGRNGSGKSAILTALVVGFGAKASVTNRGNSIKSFIKAGKASGSIEITISNCGPLAYRPSVYGNKITVQRNISSSGASSYKVRSSFGEVVSTQSKEIRRVATNLNIQIDNPICILNQDTSRNFLSTSDPKQKYILFMRATRLENLAEEYEKMTTNKQNAIRMMKEKCAVLKELEVEIKELKAKYENLKSILTLKDTLSNLELELLWAKVRDAELEKGETDTIYHEAKRKFDMLQDHIKNKGNKLEDLTAQVAELQQQILELRNESEVQVRPQIELQDKISKLQDTFHEKKREKQVVLRAIESKSRECAGLEKEISNFTAK